jgi:hypothetical protein
MAGGMTQKIECPLSKHEAMSLTPSTVKKKKNTFLVVEHLPSRYKALGSIPNTVHTHTRIYFTMHYTLAKISTFLIILQ